MPDADLAKVGDLLDSARRHRLPIMFVGEHGSGRFSPRTNEATGEVRELALLMGPFNIDRFVAVGCLTAETPGEPVVGVSSGAVGTLTVEGLLAVWNPKESEREIGVGPHGEPWPDDDRLDPSLLANGDRRNVMDQYRYWRHEAIVADLDSRRHTFHVAIENWQHDFNIGTMVRNANAFLAAEVHIIGKKKWNRRGAMVTDKYQHIRHHPSFGAFTEWTESNNLPVIGIDILPRSKPIEGFELPSRCVLLFGQEGPGLSVDAQAACETVLSIAQFGSTRSVNAGVASGIAMHAWVEQHANISG
jgi:tRNA(Leu) C34 or U34 (ribose-2'-O)-methylase TrmL